MKQNILFIQTDQHMASTIGCYGSTICQTPHLDSLAADGVRFSNAYTVYPVCSPARATIQTGVYPFKHGMMGNIYNRGCLVHELPDSPDLLSRRLQRLGYQTGFTGKWHLGFGDHKRENGEYRMNIRATPWLDKVKMKGCLPSDVGYMGDDFPGHGGIGMSTPLFKAYLEKNGLMLETKTVYKDFPYTFEVCSSTETTVCHFLARQTVDYLDQLQGRDGPFFFMLNFWGPHSPYHASTAYVDRYRDIEIPPWPSWNEAQGRKPSIHNAHRTETTADWTWDDYETMLRYYYASITETDAKIGMVIDHLKRIGAYDNTTIIFTADHGDSAGIHKGLTDKSIFMYEETIRIPLIIKPAAGVSSLAPGTVLDHFVQTADFYSTILDLAGDKRDEVELDGCSLRPLLDGNSGRWRDRVVIQSEGIDFLLHSQRALRMDHYKYVFNAGGCDELYDLAKDPHEMENLAGQSEHQQLEWRLQEALDQWMGAHNDGLQERYRRLRLMHRDDGIPFGGPCRAGATGCRRGDASRDHFIL